jgi:hypothetical protein
MQTMRVTQKMRKRVLNTCLLKKKFSSYWLPPWLIVRLVSLLPNDVKNTFKD